MNKIISSLLAVLLITNLTFATSSQNIHISNEIHKIEKQHGGKVGVYNINRNNWHNFTHSETFYFPICSVYKFLVVGAILKESMTDSNLLDEKLEFQKIKVLEPKINGVNLKNNLNKITPKIIARDLNKIAFSHDVLDKKHRILFKKFFIYSVS